MKRVLIVYFTAGGTTDKMAQFIGEGLRISGQEVVTREINDLKTAGALSGFDGYILGSPTYSLDVPAAMKTFLASVQKAGLNGKLGGAFGPYTHDVSYKHDSYAPAIILDMIQNLWSIKPFELGPLILKEDLVDTIEGMKACQDYGRIFGEKVEE
jgi:flavodoxin